MLPIWAMMALAGAAKSEMVDRPKEKRDRTLEAEKARYSGWTGMMPGKVAEADTLGSALQGGMSGAMMGQGMAQTDKMNGLMDSQKALLDSQTAANAAQAAGAGGAGVVGPSVIQSPGAVSYQPGMGQGMIAAAPTNPAYSWYLTR